MAKKPKFTDAERECISQNVREKLKEGFPMDRAIAASIAICAPGKEKDKALLHKIRERFGNIAGG